MKIQKGKLSTSNAVVIGVLVIVLYFVLPSGSQKERQNTASTPPAETTQPQPQAELAQPDATVQNNTSGTTSDTSIAVVIDTPSEVSLRAVEEINEERLASLSESNPFWTTAIAKDTRTLPEEAQATTIEATDALQDTLRARQQMKTSRISLIYSSSTGRKAAILNDEVVYPGSRISGEYLVETVHPHGLGLRTGTAPGTATP
jgi:hypothetical protein